jgi:hypothetical protein
VRPEPGVLRHVLGVGGVPHQASAIGRDLASVALQQTVEGGGLAHASWLPARYDPGGQPA